MGDPASPATNRGAKRASVSSQGATSYPTWPTVKSNRQLKFQRHFTQPIAVKNVLVAYLLWFLGGFGVLGLHRFYLGRWITGLIWLFTGGLFFIGAIIDLFLIPGIVRVENLTRQLLAHANHQPPAGFIPRYQTNG
ncbi:MAG: TM2 domain-containing protein [Phycisphaerales bacterium]|nr:TM2 domain-containing protein [Phycisphaerales bacterium]MCI0674924.1 TM2 domain-containing protein [Phycisphaerales bacterium]